jgi:hypothetical protein
MQSPIHFALANSFETRDARRLDNASVYFPVSIFKLI